LAAFLWAVKNGQFKDTYTPSIRILFDEKDNNPEQDKNQEPKEQKWS
jgi:cbb3-type cytochrome oxidase maturation protein